MKRDIWLVFLVTTILAGVDVGSAGESAPAIAVESQEYDLARCIETALSKNIEILKARERIRREHGAVVEVRAALLPQITARGAGAQLDKNRLQVLSGDAVLQETLWMGDVQLRYTLYTGGRGWATWQREKLLHAAAVTELQAVVNSVMLQVHERYYAALLAQAQIRVQEENGKLLEEELRRAQSLFRAGRASEFIVLRAEVALANSRTPLIRARNNLDIAADELARVLGIPIPPTAKSVVNVRGEMKFTPAQADLAASLSAAQKNRPELKRLSQLIEAGNQTIRQARSGYAPNISTFVGYGVQSSLFSSNAQNHSNGWSAGVIFLWPLFDGLETHGRITQAKSELALAKLAESQGKIDVDLEVRRAHSLLTEATELVKASQQVVKQAEESLRQASRRFEVGSATQLDVLDAQLALTQSRTNEIQSLHDYNVARARLAKAIGEPQTSSRAEK